MSNEVNIGDMIYLTIPKEWIKTYHSLLYILAGVGKQIIDDCSYTCQGSGRNIFTCWNLFQSALAAKALGDTKRAQFFIDYIDKELALYARHSRIIIPDFSKHYPSCIYKINNDGSYTFIITCKVNGIIYNEEITIPQKDIQPVELASYYGVSSLSDGLPITVDGLTNTFEAVDNLSINVTGSGNFAWIIVPNEAGINSVTCTDTDSDSITVLKNTTNINGYTIYYISYPYMVFENQTFIFTLSKEEQEGQEDNTKNIFIGQCNTTITGFRELDSNTIKTYTTKHKVTEGVPLGDNDTVNGVSVKDCYSFSTTIRENNRVYFVLVPTNIAIKIAKLHSTIDSYSSENEIKNSDYWEATHSNIIIDDVEYSVYGYHNVYLAGSVITIYAKLIN